MYTPEKSDTPLCTPSFEAGRISHWKCLAFQISHTPEKCGDTPIYSPSSVAGRISHWKCLACQISQIKKKPFSGLELATNRIFRTGCVDTPTLKILAFQISHIKKNKPFSGLELVTNQIFRTGCVDTPTTPPPPLIATIIIYLRSNTNPNPPWTQP